MPLLPSTQRKTVVFHIILLLCVLFSTTLQATEEAKQNSTTEITATQSALPEPLSLAAALALAEKSAPELAQAQAQRDWALAQQHAAASRESLDVSLHGRLRWVDPSDVASKPEHQDHSASLTVRSLLYDFGRKSAKVAAAEHQVQAQDLNLLAERWQQKLRVAQAFFDILLADLAFQVHTEAMAIAFIRFDRIRDRQALGQRSGLDVARAEATYEEVLQQRQASELDQRLTRARIAYALNQADSLPSSVEMPPLADNQRTLPDLEQLTTQVLTHNPRLKALKQRLQAAREQVKAERAQRLPTLHGQVEAHYWERDFSARDKARASLELQVPLYTGGYRDAQIAQAKAQQYEIQAELDALSLSLREAVIESWGQLQKLQRQRQVAQKRTYWRELEMDKRRTLYDLEFATDFGTGLVELSRAGMLEAETEYEIAMQWLRLRALSDDHLPNTAEKTQSSPQPTAEDEAS